MNFRLLLASFVWALATSVLAAMPSIPPISIKTNTSLTSKGQVIVSGITNLPDKTKFIVSINNDVRQFYASDEVTVTKGAFRTAPLGPVSGMLPGQYELEVMAPVPDAQPESVRAVIGKNGEHLKGPLVQQTRWGSPIIEYKTKLQVGKLAEGKQIDAQHHTRTTGIYSGIKHLLDKGIQMDRVRSSTHIEDARQCGILMRQYQPQARKLSDQAMETEAYPLRRAALESVSCVSCAKTAREACERGLEALLEYKQGP